LDLGQIDTARCILNQLYALNRMDWKHNLSFWDTEIAKTRVATNQVEPNAPLKMAMLTIQGPIWLESSSPAAELFPVKSNNATVVAFLGGSAEIASKSTRIQHQMSNPPGRMSRALPLFLAEQVEFRSRARTQTLIPWIAEATAGFVLSGVAWSNEEAANYARQGELKSDYVVITHLHTQTEPWRIELRLVRTIDAKCLGQLQAGFPSTAPQEGILMLANDLLPLLRDQADVRNEPPPPLYQVPTTADFPLYLLRLEQLLALRCGGMDGVPAGFLSGEREILDGNIQLCLACPQNATARLLLAQTLLTMKKVRSDILAESKEKIALPQKEMALPEPPQRVLQRMFGELFAA